MLDIRYYLPADLPSDLSAEDLSEVEVLTKEGALAKARILDIGIIKKQP